MDYIIEDKENGLIVDCLLQRKNNLKEQYCMEINSGFLLTMVETHDLKFNGNTLLIAYPKGQRPQLPYPQNKKNA